MRVTAVNNVPDIIIKPRPGGGPGESNNAGRQAVQSTGQEVVGNITHERYNEEAINKIIDQANRFLAPHNTQLSFTVHEQTREVLVKVLDSDSGEVIKEIPSEKTLDRLAAILEDIGWIIDRKI